MSNALSYLEFFLAGLLLGIPYYLSLIAVHSCVHNTFTPSKRLNGWIGEVVSFINLSRFEDYRGVHHLHHAKTNQAGKDPHYIRPGESRLHFAVTQYYQLVLFTYTDYYRTTLFREHWKDVDMNIWSVRWRDALGKVMIVSGRRPYNLISMFLPWNNVASLLVLVFGTTYLLGGPAALAYPLFFWLMPSAIGYMLIADFNYRGHVGLPEKGIKHPYQGEDSRNLNLGIGRLLDRITDGFYRHQDHHRWPSSKGSRPTHAHQH
jgi:fatty acid desaturase